MELPYPGRIGAGHLRGPDTSAVGAAYRVAGSSRGAGAVSGLQQWAGAQLLQRGVERAPRVKNMLSLNAALQNRATA